MINEKRKLIYLWTYLDWGGAQIYLMAVMKRACRDWDVIVALPKDSSTELVHYLEQLTVTLEFLDFHMNTGTAKSIRQKIKRQLSRIISEFRTLMFLRKYDLRNCVLHIESAPWQSWLFLTALSLRGANVFVTLHNALTKISGWRWMVWTLRMKFVSRLPGFHIIASNKDTKDRFKRFVTPAFWETIAVAYTAVDVVEVQNILAEPLDLALDLANERKRVDVLADEFLVICVGQFIDRKGRWTLLEAAKIINKADPRIVFRWLSPAQPSDVDFETIAQSNLGRAFQVVHPYAIGPERRHILSFYRLGDIFVLPSFVEGLPIALLEAMAFGLPCISTNVYAIPEAIDDRVNGLLLESGDSNALASSILELKNNSELRHKMSIAAQSTVISKFDESKNAEIIISEYSGCFANAR